MGSSQARGVERDLVKCKLDRSSSSGSKPKEEDENVALAFKGQLEQRKRKKDISKIKCFRCGEMDHYTTQFPLRKKDKDENHNLKATPGKIEEEKFSMTAERPLGARWADLEL